jgi:hypothetical protein
LYLTQNGAAQWGIRSDTSDASNFQVRWHGDGTNDTVLEISKAINSEWMITIDGAIVPANDNDYQIGDATHRWTSVYATNAFIQTSDARQKKDVVALGYGLKEVLSLRPVSFKWQKEPDSRVNLGLISQEVEPIVPEAVVKDSANPETPWAMTYTTLIPVLIKAVQEQQEIINSQRDRFEENRTEQAQERAALSKDKDAKIAELEARIAKLEALSQRQSTPAN